MQGIKGTLHNRGENNKAQAGQRNENHVPRPLEGLQAVGHALKSCCSRVLLLISFPCQAAGGADTTEAMLCNRESSGAPGRVAPLQLGLSLHFQVVLVAWMHFLEKIWVISECFFKVFPIAWMMFFPTPDLQCCPSLSAGPI